MAEIKIDKNLEQTLLNVLNELVLNEGITVTQGVTRIVGLIKDQNLLGFTNEDFHLIYKGVGYALAKFGINGVQSLMALNLFNLVHQAKEDDEKAGE